MAALELDRRGWHLTEESINELNKDEKGNIDNIVKKLLIADLKEVGGAWLEDINCGNVNYVKGPGVLQLETLRDVSSPRFNLDESPGIPYVCLLSLTDGHVSCSAVTTEPLRGLCLNTPPGSKLLLMDTVEINSNFLLLTNKNTSLLGGSAGCPSKSEELDKILPESESTTELSEKRGPPLFVPFGEKMTNDMLLSLTQENFKSLGETKEKASKTKDKEHSSEEIEFQKFRQTAIDQAQQDKFDKTKRACEREQFQQNVAWICQMGFYPDQASAALRASNGNVDQAVSNLFSGQQGFEPGARPPESGISSLPNPNFINYNTSPRSQGMRPQFHKPEMAFSNSPSRYGYPDYRGFRVSNPNSFRQQQFMQRCPSQFGRMRHNYGQRSGDVERMAGGNMGDFVHDAESQNPQVQQIQMERKHLRETNITDHQKDLKKSLDVNKESSLEQEVQNLHVSKDKEKNQKQNKASNKQDGAYKSSYSDQSHIQYNHSQEYKIYSREDNRGYNYRRDLTQSLRGQSGYQSFNDQQRPVNTSHHQSPHMPASIRHGYDQKQAHYYGSYSGYGMYDGIPPPQYAPPFPGTPFFPGTPPFPGAQAMNIGNSFYGNSYNDGGRSFRRPYRHSQELYRPPRY